MEVALGFGFGELTVVRAACDMVHCAMHTVGFGPPASALRSNPFGAPMRAGLLMTRSRVQLRGRAPREGDRLGDHLG